jgi:NADP-dependent aldehyde dehydrogenase
MALHGKNFLGSTLSARGDKTFRGYDPRLAKALETEFHEATGEEIQRALELATGAFAELRQRSPQEIAALLERIADEIEALGDSLIEQASAEAGFGRDRLTGERARTTGQLRLFAELVKEGSFVDARIDPALPNRKPPRPDLRRMLLPIGPVVVFGASNFPLAFSTAGGDTASALAARCPVVVKGHPAHPGTSELVAGAILRAVQKTGMPEGAFSLLNAVDPEVSLALVRHPLIRAVAFTGSERAGRAIFDAAVQREEPIPAYCEMGSINPVFLLPSAIKERAEALAQGLTKSINLGVGQFCTCPGVIIGQEDDAFRGFANKLSAEFEQSAPASMAHPGVLKGYEDGLKRVQSVRGVQFTQSAKAAVWTANEATPVIFETDAETWLTHDVLAHEVFGPSAIVVRAQSEDEMVEIARGLSGSLTATVHGTAEDLKRYRKLISVLETKVGRLVFNGYPTGVEVSHAIHHGGPYPATTDSKFTSVGTAAILRFLRPVCYQGFPDEALPPELQNANPRQIWRMVEGKREQARRGAEAE